MQTKLEHAEITKSGKATAVFNGKQPKTRPVGVLLGIIGIPGSPVDTGQRSRYVGYLASGLPRPIWTG
jgi:hypothetical protein